MKAALPLASALALPLTLAACAPAAEAPRTAVPAVPPAARAPLPAAAAPAAPPAPQWMDAALTPGRWRYESGAGGPAALFVGPRGAGVFAMACDAPRGRLVLRRAGTAPAAAAMTIRTETATRTLSAAPDGAADPHLVAELPARDPLLDAMALSKGRFAVAVEGAAPLILPSWAEVSRVIEDCR